MNYQHCLNSSVLVQNTADNCSNGETRIVNGQSAEGLLEICYDGFWGSICPSYWDNNDAKVACRQLGYTDIGMLYIYKPH